MATERMIGLICKTQTGEEAEYVLGGAGREIETYIDAGLTEMEAAAMALVSAAATQMQMLDELHPSDRVEMDQAFHVIQVRLFARPAYRAYLDLEEEPDA